MHPTRLGIPGLYGSSATTALLVIGLVVPLFGAAATPAGLPGEWATNSPAFFELKLNPDGGGSLAEVAGLPGDPIHYRVAGAQLLLEQDGEWVPFDFSLSGDVLRLSGGDLDEPLSLRRRGRGAGPNSAGNGIRAGKAGAPSGGTPPARTRAGDCSRTCQHIVACAQAGAADAARCLNDCRNASYAPEFLLMVEQADCLTTLAIVQALSGGQATEGGEGLPSRSADCNGCVWDGDTCAWYSQSNWGHGAYSGAVATCDNSCCGR